jgi:hypothetical protein
MKVKLRRAQLRGKVAVGQIDVTARTGRPEAPEWAWVKAYKAGWMSEEEYTRLYHAKRERVACLCHCRDGQFCHTVLLVEWLTCHYAAGFVGEGA